MKLIYRLKIFSNIKFLIENKNQFFDVYLIKIVNKLGQEDCINFNGFNLN